MLVLQPCLGNQTISEGDFISLVNDGEETCDVVSKRSRLAYQIPGNTTISVPIDINLVSKGKVQFSVTKSGRSFTVYGTIKDSQGVAAESNDHPRRPSSLPANLDRRRSSMVSNLGSHDADPLLFSTENLINNRLGHKDALTSPGTTPRTPHATLSLLQLEASRKSKAIAIRRDLTTILANLATRLNEGTLKVRTEPSIFHDIGFREKLWGVVDQYASHWLAEGLLNLTKDETSWDSDIRTRRSLRQIFFDAIFTNEQLVEEQKDRRQGAFPENADFVLKISRYIVLQFLELVLFLDHAKNAQLLNGCLFKPSSEAKSSDAIIVQFSTLVFAGEGDVLRHLKKIDFVTTHRQTSLDEYDTYISRGELYGRIRDGVLLSMFARSFETRADVLDQLRVPASERLHYLMNNEKIIEALAVIDASILETGRRGRITKYDIADGHKEKTVAFVWNIALKFGLENLVNESILLDEIRRVSYKSASLAHWKRTIELLADENNELADNDCSAADIRVRKLLLNWLQVVSAGYERVPPVRDFSASIADGSALCVLVHHYHPDLLPLEAISFTKFGEDLGMSEAERLRKERKNFATLNDSFDGLGELPVRLTSCNSKFPPSSQLGFACVAFLCGRLLDTTKETRAAKRIQTLWMVNRARKTGNAESEKKANRLLRDLARAKAEDVVASRDENDLVRTLVFASPRPARPKTAACDDVIEISNPVEPVLAVPSRRRQSGISIVTASKENRPAQQDKISAIDDKTRALKRSLDQAERAKVDMMAELERERRAHLEAGRSAREALTRLEEAQRAENALRERLAQLETEKDSAERAAMRERREREDSERRVAKERENRDALAREMTDLRQKMELEIVRERDASAEHFASEQSRWLALSRRNTELARALDESEHKIDRLTNELAALGERSIEKEGTLHRTIERLEAECAALAERSGSSTDDIEKLERERTWHEERARSLERKCEQLENDLQNLRVSSRDSINVLAHERDLFASKERQLLDETEAVQAAYDVLDRQKQVLLDHQCELEEALAEHRETIKALEFQLEEWEAHSLHSGKQDKHEEQRLESESELDALMRARTEEEKHISDIRKEITSIQLMRQKEEEALDVIRRAAADEAIRVRNLHKSLKEYKETRRNSLEEFSDVPSSQVTTGSTRIGVQGDKTVRFSQDVAPKAPHYLDTTTNLRKIPSSPNEIASSFIGWLQNPRTFRRVEESLLSDISLGPLILERECLKATIWGLRKCQRSNELDLRSLLRSVIAVFYREAFIGSDLTLHFANALVDVLQTFYDKPEVFSMALDVFRLVWEDYRDELSYRLDTLVELLETKTKIQSLCGVDDSICARNLKRLEELSS